MLLLGPIPIVFEEPEQIVGEFGGHVVDVNPKGKGHRVVRIREEPVHLGVKNGVVELLRHVVVLGFVAGRCVVVFEGRLSVGEEEVVEGGQERGFGIGNVEMLRGRRGAERREREEGGARGGAEWGPFGYRAIQAGVPARQGVGFRVRQEALQTGRGSVQIPTVKL